MINIPDSYNQICFILTHNMRNAGNRSLRESQTSKFKEDLPKALIQIFEEIFKNKIPKIESPVFCIDSQEIGDVDYNK